MAPRSSSKPPAPGTPRKIDTSYLEDILGYNARRASLFLVDLFMQQMAVHGLRPVDFSVLSLINHNPGITSREVCTVLSILPPNLVGIISALEAEKMVTRRAHPSDGRAMGLHLTSTGEKLMLAAGKTARQLEVDARAKLTAAEGKTLIRLLQKVYL